MTDSKKQLANAAEVLQTAVSESANVLRQASDKMDLDRDQSGDPINYTAGDLVQTGFRLAGIAVQAGSKLAGSVRDTMAATRANANQPGQDPQDQPVTLLTGTALIADYVSTVLRHTLDSYSDIMKQAVDDIETHGYRPNHYMPALTKLIDVSLVNAVEVVETVVAGPAPYAPISFRSDAFDAGPDPANDRTLAIAEDFRRPGTAEFIPPDQVTFDPPVLKKGEATTFAVVVIYENLPSGVYVGKVDVGAGQQPVEVALRL